MRIDYHEGGGGSERFKGLTRCACRLAKETSRFGKDQGKAGEGGCMLASFWASSCRLLSMVLA